VSLKEIEELYMPVEKSESIMNGQEASQKQEPLRDEMVDIYRLGIQIAENKTISGVFEALNLLLKSISRPSLLLRAEGKEFVILSINNCPDGGESTVGKSINLLSQNMAAFLAGKVFLCNENNSVNLPAELAVLIKSLHFADTAILPIYQGDSLAAAIAIGLPGLVDPSLDDIHPILDIADLASRQLKWIDENQSPQMKIGGLELISNISQEISAIQDLPRLYSVLHEHVRNAIGNPNYFLALYDEPTNSISVPYMYEKGSREGEITSIETFPLGEGLTSILIGTKRPLMLVEDTEKQARAMGAKIAGKPAKSWLGAPLIVSGRVIGAIVIQDTEHELAFTKNDLEFVTTLSGQAAGAIYNIRLLEESRARALQLETAAEIARDISSSLEVGELLGKAVTLIRERLNFYHSAVFLIEPSGEYALIREATGEAGSQMKRAGHKLKVGSKSIVGYVTGSGEPLIVNDTSRDATYFANPLLPETRAEVAIPLKVGTRILGAMDVQSTRAYSFGKEVVSVLRILADQMAVAVINSELFAETQEHLSQHRLLYHITTAAASGSTLEESLNSAAQGLQVTLGGDRVAIILADKDKKKLHVKATAGYSEEVNRLEIQFGEGISGWVAEHQKSQRINDVTQDPRYIKIGTNVRSELAIPLVYRGEFLGVLNVESDQIGAYSENDEELLGTLGGSLAAVIANARLFEQVQQQVDRERMLYEITSKIRRSTDIQTIMATTATELSKALGARSAHITIDPGDFETKKD
jgi:GAF domain-containing protein